MDIGNETKFCHRSWLLVTEKMLIACNGYLWADHLKMNISELLNFSKNFLKT